MAGLLGEDPELQRVFRGHRDAVNSVAFCAGAGRGAAEPRLVTGSKDGTVMVWHQGPQQHLRAFRFIGHSDAVHRVSYDPCNNLIASASKDKTVRLWRPSAEGRSTVLKAHTAAVRCAAFAPNGRLLATASDDKTVKLWSVPQQAFVCSLTGHSNWVRACDLAPDARLAVSGGDDRSVRVWDLETRTALLTFDSPDGAVNATRFHTHGNCMATGGSDGTVRLWDLRANRLIQLYEAHAGPVTDLAFHPGGSFLLSSGMDGTLKVLDLQEGSVLYTLHGHEGPALGVGFSHAGDQFASASADKTVLVWRTGFDAALGEAVEAAAVRGSPKRQPGKAAPAAKPSGLGRPKTAPLPQAVAGSETIPALLPCRLEQAQGDSHAVVQSASLNVAGLPEGLAGVLQALVVQLDTLTQTAAAMEERLTLSEDRAQRMEAALAQLASRGGNVQQQQQEEQEAAAAALAPALEFPGSEAAVAIAAAGGAA